MAGGDVTLKIDADTAGYIAKIAKLAEEHGKVTKKIREGADESEKLSASILKTVSGVVGLAAVASSLAASLKNARDHAAELSRSMGSQANTLAPSLYSLGLNKRQVEATIEQIRSGQGAASPEQMTSFIGTLAAENDERSRINAPRIDQGRALTAISEYRSGGDSAFGANGNLLSRYFTDNMFKWRNDPIGEVASGIRTSRLGGEGVASQVAEEQSIREYENQKAYETSLEVSGGRLRKSRADLEKSKTTDPLLGAAVSILDTATFGYGTPYAEGMTNAGVKGDKAVGVNSTAPDIVNFLVGRFVLRADSAHSE